ncbi:transposase [Diaphorobacter sp. JS3050]|uniref:IS66-like element accessory protein TnpA n=1 Tax=Diaphorobacter sp. JS3050 TaxID=2735554 RepID=UPI000EB71EF0|nr:transposase [Diaphorobacter sp. JS3050]AYE88721.1 transposase IS3/IS911 family protein [Diaphorobacter sp.]QJY33123.1 transposase [Diaphorobacter sp. JS3050]
MDKRVTSGKDTRRKHSEELKQALVERSLEPGASVAAIAQEHGINANLLFNWRRLHLRAQAPAVEAAASPTLLPVTVQMEPAVKTPKVIAPRPSSGVIEIDVGATRVRLRGAVDETSVRCVLRLLGAIA